MPIRPVRRPNGNRHWPKALALLIIHLKVRHYLHEMTYAKHYYGQRSADDNEIKPSMEA